MKNLNSFKLSILIGLALTGCGKDKPVLEDFKGEEYFPPPVASDVIAPVWVRVATLGVTDHSDYDAHIEVSVKGRSTNGKDTECVFITTHPSFRQDRGWSPLPFTFFSPDFESPDGKVDLNDLFREALDFDDKKFDEKLISLKVTFTRGKTFTSEWQIYPLLKTDANGNQHCSALATLKRSPQVGCHSDRCAVHQIMAEVNAWRHFTQRNNPPRQMDDLSALKLQLGDLDASGALNGTTYDFNVPEFK